MSESIPSPRWDHEITLPAPRQNRDVTFSHRIESLVMKGLMSLFRSQPIEKASARMAGFMKILGPMLFPIHRRGHQNLQLIYPDMTAAERSAILRGAWQNLGATVAEFAHLDKLYDRVTLHGEEHLTPLIETGQRAIFVSGHFANWEAMAITLYQKELKYAVVYRAANNPLVDAEIIERRGDVMSRRQIPKGPSGARDLIKVLKENLSICMLVDQKLNDGISVPFLGHEAMTAPATARLALKENLPIIPIQIVRKPGAYFDMTLHPPLEVVKSGDMKKDVETVTTMINEKLGEFILNRPDQWLLFHRRWPRRLTG
ncbi:MAG: lauroyl acyltransferase [Pseudomonadota bacterium]